MSVDEHSFDPGWDEIDINMDEAEEALEDVDFDTQLGLELAKDAQLLAEGEITEDEFYDRHNDAVEEEFGIDARPTDPNHVEPLPEEVVQSAVDGEKIEDVPAASQSWNDSVGTGGGGGDGGGGDDGAGAGDDDGQSRRSFLKSTGALAAGLTAATWANRNPAGVWDDDGPEEQVAGSRVNENETQLGMVIDLQACVGDLVCVDACERENQSPEGALWQFVFQYQEPEREEPNFLVRPCQHCSNPPCVSVCPVRARHKRESDGIVLTDYDICIGCRYCQVACPYGVNYFQWGDPTEDTDHRADPEKFEERYGGGDVNPSYDKRGRNVAGAPHEQGVMTKCTFCVHRQDSDDIDNGVDPSLAGTTACEQSCPQNAIQFGDLNDEESQPSQYLREMTEKYDNTQTGSDASSNTTESGDSVSFGRPSEYDADGDHLRLSTFRFQESRGTSPNVIYIGDEPSQQAEWASDEMIEEGLSNTYEGMGLDRSSPKFSRPDNDGGGH